MLMLYRHIKISQNSQKLWNEKDKKCGSVAFLHISHRSVLPQYGSQRNLGEQKSNNKTHLHCAYLTFYYFGGFPFLLRQLGSHLGTDQARFWREVSGLSWITLMWAMSLVTVDVLKHQAHLFTKLHSCLMELVRITWCPQCPPTQMIHTSMW